MPALALARRHPHFWRAVGLVAGALMREKTLDGYEVEALVRAARHDSARPILLTPPAGPRRPRGGATIHRCTPRASMTRSVGSGDSGGVVVVWRPVRCAFAARPTTGLGRFAAQSL